jgi:hypothetical protein
LVTLIQDASVFSLKARAGWKRNSRSDWLIVSASVPPVTNVKNDIARLRRHRRSGTRIAAAAKAMPTMVQNFERDSLTVSVSAVSGGGGGGAGGAGARAVEGMGRTNGCGDGRLERPVTTKGSVGALLGDSPRGPRILNVAT